MTADEMSNEFDVLLNSYALVPAQGEASSKHEITLDEYEKSAFLTEAQEQIVIELYTGRNEFTDSFESTEELRRYLDSLVKSETLTDRFEDVCGVSDNSQFFILPDDLWFITYESVLMNDDNLGCLNRTRANVVPVTQDEFYRINRNPFRKASEKRVLRLDLGEGIVELVSDYNIGSYLVRYLSKPSPIIVTDLGSLTLNGVSEKTDCILHSGLHRPIVERAVRLAIASRTRFNNSNNKQ